jgi:hypothetical protein
MEIQPTRYSQNREELLAYQKQKYKENREVKIAYQIEYNRIKKDDLQEYNSKYYEQNKEQLLAKAKTIVVCSCGREISKGNLTSHLNTKLHFKFLELENRKTIQG